MTPLTAGPAPTGLDRPEAILQALIRSMGACPACLPAGIPDRAAAEARLAGGVPALLGEPLLAWDGMVEGAERLAGALGGAPAAADARAASGWLRDAVNGEDRDRLLAAALAGSWAVVHALARRRGVVVEVACTLLDCAARPALRAGAAAVAGLPGFAGWSRGICPACGAPPTLGVIVGKERERRLCCGRCGTGWSYPRLRCTACGERDHRRLGALHGAGEGDYRRVEVCESCGGYLKTVAALEVPGADRVLQLDLATAGLDFLALEHGYRR